MFFLSEWPGIAMMMALALGSGALVTHLRGVFVAVPLVLYTALFLVILGPIPATGDHAGLGHVVFGILSVVAVATGFWIGWGIFMLRRRSSPRAILGVTLIVACACFAMNYVAVRATCQEDRDHLVSNYDPCVVFRASVERRDW